MKTTLLSFFILISLIEIKAQTSAQLDINNINARVNIQPSALFTHPTINDPGFEVPVGSGKHTIYAANLWIGGKDSSGNVHLAAPAYSSFIDYINGPIMDSQHYASEVDNWDSLWILDRTIIENHILNFSNTGYIIPQVLLDWPAHGDTSLGQALNLAPYYDFNNDQIYNPSEGDYPEFPGDKCIFYIFNDDTLHLASGGEKMKLEFHVFVYAYECNDDALNNTVFVKYKIFNRSKLSYTETHVGIWSDMDIGNPADDYVGCDVARSSYYCYNGDIFDEGASGYGNELSAQSAVFLAGPYLDPDGIDNPYTTNIQNAIDSSGIPYEGAGNNYSDGIIDNERLGLSHFLFYPSWGFINDDPLYGLLQGNFDGTPITYDTTGILYPYVFPGDSDPLFWGTTGVPVGPWSEVSNSNQPGDRKLIGSSGPFTFHPGQINELDLAFVFARDYVNLGDNLSPISIMNERIDSVRNYFTSNQTPCGTGFQNPLSLNKIKPEKISFSIYPNPSSSHFILNFEGEIKNINYSIHDILGKEILSGKINSAETTIDCENWSSGVYLIKMGDENGYSVQKIVVEK